MFNRDDLNIIFCCLKIIYPHLTDSRESEGAGELEMERFTECNNFEICFSEQKFGFSLFTNWHLQGMC